MSSGVIGIYQNYEVVPFPQCIFQTLKGRLKPVVGAEEKSVQPTADDIFKNVSVLPVSRIQDERLV